VLGYFLLGRIACIALDAAYRSNFFICLILWKSMLNFIQQRLNWKMKQMQLNNGSKHCSSTAVLAVRLCIAAGTWWTTLCILSTSTASKCRHAQYTCPKLLLTVSLLGQCSQPYLGYEVWSVMQQWLCVWQSYQHCWWAETALCWCLAQSAAERYWHGRQRVEKVTENVHACNGQYFNHLL